MSGSVIDFLCKADREKLFLKATTKSAPLCFARCSHIAKTRVINELIIGHPIFFPIKRDGVNLSLTFLHFLSLSFTWNKLQTKNWRAQD